MSFRMWTRVGPVNHVLDEGPHHHMQLGNFDGKKLSAWEMAGWNSKINNSSTTASELQRNGGPRRAFQLQETMLKTDKIWCRYLVINRVRLRTFWTPLVRWQAVVIQGVRWVPPCATSHCMKPPTIMLSWQILFCLLPDYIVIVYFQVGAVVQRVRHLGLRSVGCGFKSCSRQRCVTTLGKLFTPMCLCHQAV